MSSTERQLPAPGISDGWTVNEVLARFPSTVEVFNRFGVDTCCGGDMPLRDAALHARADRDVLLAALDAAAGVAAGAPRAGTA